MSSNEGGVAAARTTVAGSPAHAVITSRSVSNESGPEVTRMTEQGLPVTDNEVTLGELARGVTVIDGAERCMDVERIFASNRDVSGLAVRTSQGELVLVDRSDFEYQMTGPLGYGRMLLMHRTVESLLTPGSPRSVSALTSVREAHAALLRRDQEQRFKDILVVGEEEDETPTIGVVSAARLLEEVARLNAEDALRDSLTGLANREQLSRWLRALARPGAESGGMALLFVDIDRFKVINDSMGHAVGDALLVEFGRRLGECVRAGDSVARFGGDEFTVLLARTGGREEAASVAGRILDAMHAPFMVAGESIMLSCSVGIAQPEPGDDQSDLLRRADIAMYQAKQAGRSQYRFFSGALGRQATERRDIEVWLRGALETRALFLQYQPIVDLSGRRLAGFEALVRGHHPERGVLMPGEFLAVADEAGLLQQLDLLVLEAMSETVAGWIARRPAAGALRYSVNMSAKQLDRKDVVSDVERVLARTGLDPRCLQIEITEETAARDVAHAARALSALRDMGIRIAIDDFGTGYSSLAQLGQIPADVLKVDRSFVAHMETRTADLAVVKLILALGHAMALDITGEGIETRGQADRLEQLGCTFGQGYYFAHPSGVEAAEAWIRDYAEGGAFHSARRKAA